MNVSQMDLFTYIIYLSNLCVLTDQNMLQNKLKDGEMVFEIGVACKNPHCSLGEGSEYTAKFLTFHPQWIRLYISEHFSRVTKIKKQTLCKRSCALPSSKPSAKEP